MENLKPIVNYYTDKYGYVRLKLKETLDARGVTRNRLRTLTGVKYDVIDRYYKSETVHMADLDFLAKDCCVLNCGLDDLLEYVPE